MGLDQLDLLTSARNSDPETSHLAAEGAHRTAHAFREECYRALMVAGPAGLTDFELADRVGRQQTSAGKRRGELVTRGVVEDSGQRRRTPSGSTAIVWRVKLTSP